MTDEEISELVTRLIDRIGADLYNVGMLSNPFAVSGRVAGSAIISVGPSDDESTPTSAILLYRNNLAEPVILVAQMAPVGGGTISALCLATDSSNTTLSKANIVDFGQSPKGSLILGGNSDVYAAAICSAATTVRASVLRFQAGNLIFGDKFSLRHRGAG